MTGGEGHAKKIGNWGSSNFQITLLQIPPAPYPINKDGPLFTVSLDGLSGRGTTRNLDQDGKDGESCKGGEEGEGGKAG